jgi:NADH dehydrogenase
VPSRPRIVIVGAGFGGLAAAQSLDRVDADVIVIDKQNYHLFQPLLYQVATAGLAPSDIAWPIRSILSRQQNASILLDTVCAVDRAASVVVTEQQRMAFDYLVLATGARHSYFGHDGWEIFAPGLKSIDDATAIRRRILLAFEQADVTADEAERRRLLNFAIIGGGPTGVELAGTIAELARRTLAKDFRRIDSRSARVILIEAGPRLLPTISAALSAYTETALGRLGVEVMLGHAVTDCDGKGVIVDSEAIPAATVLWAAGVRASAAGRWLDVETDRAGRVLVKPDLSIDGLAHVFAIGDTAAVIDAAGHPVPGIAPAAKQQGRYVAKAIRARIEGRASLPPFRYRHAGNLATIGRKAAVIEFPLMRLSGYFAWWVWGIAHIYFLIGVQSPLLVATRWLREYATYGRGARLITGR